MTGELITQEATEEFAIQLQEHAETLGKIAEVEAAKGAIVASVARVKAIGQMDRLLLSPAAKQMFRTAIASRTIEIARQTQRDEVPEELTPAQEERAFAVCREALRKGLLLSHESGQHFTVFFSSQQRASLLIKEPGYRYKLQEHGAKKIEVAAAVLDIEGAVAKMQGYAKCLFKGESFETLRTPDFPLLIEHKNQLQPDKLESQARRRLLRDLWAQVSGETCESLDESTPADVQATAEQPAHLLDNSTLAQAEGMLEGDLSRLRDIWRKMKDPSEKDALQALINAIKDATSPEDLQGENRKELNTMAGHHGQTIQRLVKRCIDNRITVLKG